MPESVGFLYINGLGDGRTTAKDKIVEWWWQRAGLSIKHSHTNWYDGKPLEDKLEAIERQVGKMLQDFGGVAIIGSSAGGSLAFNSFYNLKDKNVCAVITHGRLRAGNYTDNQLNSLHHRAHLDTDRPSQSFFDSVTMAETQVIPRLTDHDKERLLVLTQLTDMVVPMECMGIEGVRQHRSIAFGHSGGFVAHLLADRDMIAGFAKTQL